MIPAYNGQTSNSIRYVNGIKSEKQNKLRKAEWSLTTNISQGVVLDRRQDLLIDRKQ